MWIKWYPMQWLHSTCRDELNAAERATFQDFVCLAAVSPNPGSFKYVCDESLARTLNTSVSTIKSTLEKCIKKNRIKLKEGPEGIVCMIIKWPDYQSFGPKRPKKKPLLPPINFNFEKRTWEGIQDEDIKQWTTSFPSVDVKNHLDRMAQWLLANPNRRKIKYRRFIVNWLSREQDKARGQILAGGKKEIIKKEIDDWVKGKSDG